MDKETRKVLKAMAEGHDELVERVAALTAILGAMLERYPVLRPRVDAWCRQIAGHSDQEVGADYVAIRKIAYDFLQGIDGASED